MGNKDESTDLDVIINKFPDWRGATLNHIRGLMRQADTDMTEDVKWKTPSNPEGVAAWYKDGMICTGEVYKKHLRIGFAKGPQLEDPSGLVNSYRAIILHESDTLDDESFIGLVKNAVKLNQQTKQKPKPAK